MFLNRALIGFLVLVGVPAYAMTINVPDRAENGAVIPVEINLDKPLTAGQRLDLLVNGELAAQVKVVKGKLTAFSTRVKGSQSNTTITARVIANGSELDSASRNVAVTLAAERMGGSPTPVVGDMRVRTQNGEMRMLMQSENGFAGTLVVQDAGFRVEIRGSTLISKNPFVGLKGEFLDQVSASINGRTQQDVVKVQPSLDAGAEARMRADIDQYTDSLKADINAQQAANAKLEAERSSKDRQEALGILVGAIGQYQQNKTDRKQAQQEEQQRRNQEQPRIGTLAAGLSRQQISTCSEEIKNKQIESQSWGGDVNDTSARLGQFQKSLFEGRCAGHPEAQSYIAGANKMIGYGGNAAGSGGSSGGRQANVEIQGSPQCAKYYIVSETQETRISHKMFSFGIQNICNFPVYISWFGYFNDVRTLSIDYSHQLKKGTGSRLVFGPGGKIEAIPFRILNTKPFQAKIYSVCPTEDEATRLTGKRIDHVDPGARGMCIARIFDTRGVRTSQ